MLSAKVSVKWHGGPFTRKLRAGLGKNLAAAADVLKAGVMADITAIQGSYNPPFHSAPGERPYVITGDVASSFDMLVDRRSLYAMVYSDDPVSRYLEFGTSRMEPRPYFLKGLLGRKRILARLMCMPII